MIRFSSLLAVCLAVPAVSSGDWLKKYQVGLDLARRGETSVATAEISSALQEAEARLVPGHQLAMMVHLLGQLEYRSGHYRSSLKYFERVLKLLPPDHSDLAMVFADAAQSCINLAEVGRAGRLIREALDRQPQQSEYWHLLGVTLYMAGRHPEAEEATMRAIGLLGTDRNEVYGASQNLLAAVYIRRKQYREAIEALDAALLSVTDGLVRANARANRGSVLWKLGKREEAVADLRTALADASAALGPSHPELIYILDEFAIVLERMGRKKEARNAAKRAAEIRASFDDEANVRPHAVSWHDLR